MLTAFTAGLLLITCSELGDKTFFIAVILAMRHSRRLVFAGVIAALAAMTLMSVAIGHTASILPKTYIHWAELALFFGFGLKLLYEASQMPAKSENEEAKEALETVQQAEKRQKRETKLSIVQKAFAMTFVAEWGDRTQIATMALASSYQPVGVTVGSIVGHTICTAIAVLGGRLIAGRISERMITAIGGSLFLLFGAISLWEGV